MSILPAVVKTTALAVALVVASVMGPSRHLSEAVPGEADDMAAPANAFEFYCLEIVGCVPAR
ncbi:MAG: hypothetical protein ACXU9B_18490 [Reyranella sp.]